MPSFASLPADTWQLQSLDDANRRKRLSRSPSYPQLVSQLASRSEILRAAVEPAKKEPRALRLNAILRVDSSELDLFFNSRSGYRAQYYAAMELGDSANRLAVDALLPALAKQAIYASTGYSATDVARDSLEAEAAKLWIHQGLWLRQCRHQERVLTVPRWQLGLTSEDRRTRKLARWGSLAPSSEVRVVVKGAFILEGMPTVLGKAPHVRTRELHSLGFT